MKSKTNSILILVFILFTGTALHAQQDSKPILLNTTKTKQMKTYVIEREIPGAGKLTSDQLKGISQASCSVLKELGTGIEWLHSYVTGNKIFCVYKSDSEELIKEHAKKGGFPANTISEVTTVISPATAQ